MSFHQPVALESYAMSNKDNKDFQLSMVCIHFWSNWGGRRQLGLPHEEMAGDIGQD